MKRRFCLSALVIFAILVSSVSAQELDEFVYLPIIIKSPQPPDCNFYEPNDTPEQANWIQNGETQTHCIVPKTDVDWVKFSLSEQSGVVIETLGLSGDTRMWLYDSNLNQIAYNDDGGTGLFSRITLECGIWGDSLAAGTYYVKIDEFSNNAEIPSYDITLTVNPCPTPVILANYSHWTAYGILIVAGEVQNDGEVGLDSVRVTANLFDNGGLIDTDTDYVELNVLPPNDRTCFAAALYDDVTGWSHYEFETPTYSSTSNEWLQNMTVYGDSGTRIDDSYRIVGFIRNDNDFQVKYVQPIATLYNASNIVIGCEYTTVSSTDLDPGQSSSFEFDFGFWNWSGEDVALYRIQVDGYP